MSDNRITKRDVETLRESMRNDLIDIAFNIGSREANLKHFEICTVLLRELLEQLDRSDRAGEC